MQEYAYQTTVQRVVDDNDCLVSMSISIVCGALGSFFLLPPHYCG